MGNFSRFFIDRPVFAMVLAIIITLAGTIAAFSLPVAQYPEIAPPTVTISTTYPGASAETIASTVAAPIEEQLSGAEGMIYYASNSGSDSTLAITATFEVGTDVDKAVFQLNNRVQVALPRLPEEVRRNGVLVQKRSNDILVVIALRSTDDSRSSTYLADYAYVNLVDDLKRIPGVGDVTLFGAISSMRVWLQPDKMARLGVTPSDVLTVIRGQNAQFAAGKVGAEPAPPGQALTFTVNARGRLQRAEEFENLIVRANGPQGVLRLKDVATVELGALNYDTFPAVDGKTAIGMAVFLQTGANALQVTDNVKKRMEEVKAAFPTGVEYLIPFDTTLVVKSSIAEVKLTIIEAALLVLAVVFLFLQTWRATIIPMLAVPVSIIGTFAGLYALGFSINTLTLFAMVLAIGIVVDDAIVVLENVERLMREQKMRAREATIAAMHEVSGAVLAIVLVLCAVFIPVAFLGGIAGQLYKQFAVTVAVAVVISGFTALTLTPALCALLLEVHDEEPRLFKPFNRAFAAITRRFLAGVNLALARRVAAGFAFLGLLLFAGLLFWRVPTSFLPSEDQGYLLGTLQLPDGASIQRTKVTAAQMQKIISEESIVDHAFVVPGRDLIGGSNKTNAGTMFILLKDWDTRKKTASELATELTEKGSKFTDGRAIAFNPPSIRGLGTAGGFEFYVQSRTNADPQRLGQVTNEVVEAMGADARLQGMNTFFRPTAPQLFAQVDREKAISMGIPPEDVFNALQSTFGTFYVNDFNLGGRTFRVQVQAEPGQRSKPEQLGAVYVRSNTTGEMVPLRALLTVRETAGPEQVERFNGFLAAKVLGSGKPGISSGQAIDAVEEVAAKVLPAGYSLAWSGQAFQEKRTGSQSVFAFGLAIVMVFLILAALYERWRLPTAVVLAVPFAILGALGLVALRGMENDIYFQIGLVVLIGLAAKNAILIVEFAQQGLLRGMSAKDAAIDAARLRFRPIVMTSLAFVFGVLPLGHLQRRGLRSTAFDGHRRGGRHAGRHLRRHHVHPALLRVVLEPPQHERCAAPRERAGRAADGRAHSGCRRMKRLVIPAALALALAGCAMVGPDYERPATGLPAQFAGNAAGEAPVLPAQWWTLYGDALLESLVRESLEKNTDLLIAAARVDEAEAVLREAHAALVVPQVNLEAGAVRGRVPGNTPPVGNAFSLGASTAFEVDVWGRLRRGERAARENLLATRYAQETVRITLAATVARTFFGIRALDAQRIASQSIYDAGDQSLTLARKRADAGLVPALDIYQASSLRSQAAAQLREIARQREALEHQLGVLVGRLDVTVEPGTLTSLPIPPQPPAGLPSQLLERRPDVREAEARLAGATELVGVARGSQFPALSLTAGLGVANPEIGNLFTTGSQFWSFGAGIVGPLIDGGRNAARTDQAAARARQAEASYQGTVRDAFRDVADALSNVQRAGETEVELEQLVADAREALRLSQRRYESGYSPYLEVLDAQRTLNNAQIQLIRNRQNYLSYTVDLMVALGGGWTA